MIDNFEATKHQLKELAPLLNAFKSEAVQLRLVELIFAQDSSADDVQPPPAAPQRRKRKPRAASKSSSPSKTSSAAKKEERKPRKRTSGNGTGAHAMVSLLVDNGFFKKPQSIRGIIDHLGANKGRHFKANQVSPSLLRLLREGRLTRHKNADNQYEYSQS